MLERYDECLADNGIPIHDEDADAAAEERFDELAGLEDIDELTDEDLAELEALESGWEAAFEACEPILDELSEDAEWLFADFEDCPDDELEATHIEEEA